MMMRVLVAVFAPLTIIATVLRFVARGQKKVALGLDDFFALLALITFCALLGASYWGESKYPPHEDERVYGPADEVYCSGECLHFGWSWHSILLTQSIVLLPEGMGLISRACPISCSTLTFAIVVLGLWYPGTDSAQLCQIQYSFLVPSTLL